MPDVWDLSNVRSAAVAATDDAIPRPSRVAVPDDGGGHAYAQPGDLIMSIFGEMLGIGKSGTGELESAVTPKPAQKPAEYTPPGSVPYYATSQMSMSPTQLEQQPNPMGSPNVSPLLTPPPSFANPSSGLNNPNQPRGYGGMQVGT